MSELQTFLSNASLLRMVDNGYVSTEPMDPVRDVVKERRRKGLVEIKNNLDQCFFAETFRSQNIFIFRILKFQRENSICFVEIIFKMQPALDESLIKVITIPLEQAMRKASAAKKFQKRNTMTKSIKHYGKGKSYTISAGPIKNVDQESYDRLFGCVGLTTP